MTIKFMRRSVTSEFESPFDNFKLVRMSAEIRTCPLSGHVTRIMPFRVRQLVKTDLMPLVERSVQAGCPFCPESLEAKTTRFPDYFGINGGRIRYGETVVFPNAFPYAEHSAVAVMTGHHFLTPRQFDPVMVGDALRACRTYFEKVSTVTSGLEAALVNWNYMPLAGAGLVHPHVQAVALSQPTLYHRSLQEAQEKFGEKDGRSIFETLACREEELGERYISRTGVWHWVAAFAPRGLYEFWGILGKEAGILDLTDDDMSDVASGIHGVLNFFDDKNIQAFNCSCYSFYRPFVPGMRTMIAIAPRINYPPFDVSDINYFDRLHRESITFVTPEDVAKEIRPYFSEP